MKKIIIITVILMMTGIGFGQTLQKGALLGIYHFDVTLATGVTFDMYLNFLKNKHLPELEKRFTGTKGYILKGDRGEHKNEYALLWYFESVETRDRYIDAEGDWTELGQSTSDSISTWRGLNSLGTWSQTLTDWVIQ